MPTQNGETNTRSKHIRDEPGNWLIRDALGID